MSSKEEVAAPQLTLTPSTLQGMALGGVFTPAVVRANQEPAVVTSIDFHHGGEFCASANAVGDIQLLNAHSGRRTNTIRCAKYGAELIRFTHHQEAVICSSRNSAGDHDVRYLSLYDNKYIGYFRGHQARVVALDMSPIDDTFISGAMDGCVRLWSLRAKNCAAMLRVGGGQQAGGSDFFPCCAFDPTGVCFAATTGTELRLFDVRNLRPGPFTTLALEHCVQTRSYPTSIEFSPDNSHILVGTSDSALMRIDAFGKDAAQHYTGHTGSGSADPVLWRPCFTPDSKYVLAGSADGSVLVWDASSTEQVAVWQGHAGPVHSVRWNPRVAMVASGCTNVAFWVHPE